MNPALFEENERLEPKRDHRRTLRLNDFPFDLGAKLPSVDVAYETWGRLNPAKDNAVLVCHALSGDSHAVGWWDRIVGPGKVLDPARWFIICSNTLGGCQGSTGPGTLLSDGSRLGPAFPDLTISDMVRAQRLLIESLGISRLALVCGGSMGGMQALAWAVDHPEMVARCWTTASAPRHNAMQIGFNEAARQAILRDPNWCGGRYSPENPPVQGLAVARMLGHLTYLSPQAFDTKFGRRRQRPDSSQFAVESYLSYQGEKFTKRFDAGSLVTLTRAIDAFSLDSLDQSEAEFLFTSFNTDWIYPSCQSQELVEMARQAGRTATWLDIDLPFGHDAFLLDDEYQTRALMKFIEA
jgi:homoserine O-acetyltransferase/O-succinyltransferase